MKKAIFFITGVVCLSQASYGQSPATPQPLGIGERLPDIVLKHVLNYRDSTITVSEQTGIPLLFDFFSTWCGACRAGLPRLDSLQKKFKDRLQIIVVSPEPTAKIEEYLKKDPVARTLTLPFVTADTLLMQYFPHNLWPHEVWIDRSKNVRAITSAYYITAANVNALIHDRPLDLPRKQDRLDFNSNNSILTAYKAAACQPFYSIFGKAIPGLPGLTAQNKNTKRQRFLYTNASILNLYRNAVPNLTNRILIEGIDSSRLFFDSSASTPDEWTSANTYCYEITVPPKTRKEDLQQYMVEDLNRHLKLRGHREKRLVKCWALVSTKPANHSFYGMDGPNKLDYRPQTQNKTFQNLPMKQFISILNHQAPGMPQYPIIVNETGYSGKINMTLAVQNIHSIRQLKAALKTYQLDLIPVKRKLQMFILMEK